MRHEGTGRRRPIWKSWENHTWVRMRCLCRHLAAASAADGDGGGGGGGRCDVRDHVDHVKDLQEWRDGRRPCRRICQMALVYEEVAESRLVT